MSKQKRNDNFFFYLALLAAAFAITAFCTATGAYTQYGYTLKAGDVSDRRFKATRNAENTIATERNRKEAEKAAIDMKPLRKRDAAIDDLIINNVSGLFVKLDSIRGVYQMELDNQSEVERQAAANNDTPNVAVPSVTVSPKAPSVTDAPDNLLFIIRKSKRILTQMAVAGLTASTTAYANDPLMPLSAMEQLDRLQLTLSDAQSRLLLDMDDEHYEKLKQAVPQSLSNVLEQGVQEVDAKSLLSIQDALAEIDITNDMRNIGYQIASHFLQPNYVTDEAATAAARQEIASHYTVVNLKKGQTIVDEGQIISAEAYALLETLGYISDGLQNTLIPLIASIALEAILFVLCFVYIRIFCQKLFKHKKEAALLFTVYTAIIIAIRLLIHVPYQFLPILIFTMLTAMLVDSRLSIVLNIFVTTVAMLIYNGGIEFFLFFAATGLAVSLLSKYTTERNQVFIVGILAAALNFVVTFLILLFFQRTYSQNIVISAGYAAGSGIFTVIVCLGSLPFWEAFFGVITNIKLLDLTNPNNALLRKLIIETPGTYHHSLVVANLAETAAYEIGADANLARVGGYYHDIGKLKNSHFFAENQNLAAENPHNGLTPLESVKMIVEHVRYGMELANKYKLPQAVKDFIVQHHGTTLIQYFYCKAKETCAEGEKLAERDFRYPFIIPQSKETAILMMADTVEAAIRSVKKGFKDFDEIEMDIKRLIRAKLDDGQLLDSGLSIKDLDLITKAFFRVFKGMYHERIEYPRMETREISSSPSEDEVSTA
ncbi:MAG: HDIG domain-containing protein [Clostridiales bacterium]|jgi:putative nucleotidyltransferase with HDIG domain|nr:HDIG domain-containing protein [Clostridiales bacterium]